MRYEGTLAVYTWYDYSEKDKIIKADKSRVHRRKFEKKEIKEKDNSENALVLVATICCCMKPLLLALVRCYCLLVQQGDVSV